MSVCLCECVFVIKIRLQKISSSASPTADRVSERSSFVTGVVHRNHQKSLAPSRSGIKPGTNPFLRTVGHNASFLSLQILPLNSSFSNFVIPLWIVSNFPQRMKKISKLAAEKKCCRNLVFFFHSLNIPLHYALVVPKPTPPP